LINSPVEYAIPAYVQALSFRTEDQDSQICLQKVVDDGAASKGIVNEEDIQYIDSLPFVLAIYRISSQIGNTFSPVS
jgi:hypothetical protein